MTEEEGREDGEVDDGRRKNEGCMMKDWMIGRGRRDGHMRRSSRTVEVS